MWSTAILRFRCVPNASCDPRLTTVKKIRRWMPGILERFFEDMLKKWQWTWIFFYFLKFFVATSRSIQRAVLMQSPKHWCDMKGKPMGLSTPQVHHGCYLLVVLLLVLVSIYSLSCVPGCLHMYIYIYKYTIRCVCVCVQVYISLMPRQAPELNITNACPNKYPQWSGFDVWLNDAMYLTLITN